VFWRETGMKDDDEDVDAREGACSIETAMLESLGPRAAGQLAGGCVLFRRRYGFIWRQALCARRWYRAEASVQRDCGVRNSSVGGRCGSRRRCVAVRGIVAPQRGQWADGRCAARRRAGC
jgi:hypothetical protein